MLVQFTPAKTGALREFHSATLHCYGAGEYEVSEEYGAELCEVYPAHFAPVKAKAKSAPTHNKAAKQPESTK